jgi:hypothetical protein
MITLNDVFDESLKLHSKDGNHTYNCFVSCEVYRRLISYATSRINYEDGTQSFRLFAYSGPIYIFYHLKLTDEDLIFTNEDNIDKLIHDREFHNKLMGELE